MRLTRLAAKGGAVCQALLKLRVLVAVKTAARAAMERLALVTGVLKDSELVSVKSVVSVVSCGHHARSAVVLRRESAHVQRTRVVVGDALNSVVVSVTTDESTTVVVGVDTV